jgi:acyl-CoA synthetase (AMP-forming)/AMP-acid ligase II
MPTKIYRSPLPDVELCNKDLVSFLFSNPYNIPKDKTIFVDGVSGRGHTYADVIYRTHSLACGLRKLGVQPDDIVSVVSPNFIDYPIICYAIMGCGATVSPCDAALNSSEVQHQLQTTQTKYLIIHSSLISAGQETIKGTAVQCVIQADGEESLGNGMPTLNDLVAGSPAEDLLVTPPVLLDKRPAFICFSSGTTGPAKGVITTHRNLTANLQQWDALYLRGISPTLTGVAFMPFSHISGISTVVCGGVLRGTTTAILSRFNMDDFLRNVQQHRPEELSLVPPIAILLVNDPRVPKYNLRSVKRVFSTAAPLSIELSRALEERFRTLYGTTVHCHQAWGMSETSPLATGVPPDRMEKRHTVGCIVPNMQFRLVDPKTLQDVQQKDSNGTLHPGEILCRGPNVTKGYYRNDVATRGLFYIDTDGDTWLRTGDIAIIDREGYLVIQDRIKEMIKYKGLQIIPSELEGILLEHPDVTDCAVTARWAEDQATELPVAFVVLIPSARSRSPSDVARYLDAWLTNKVAPYKRLRGGIRFIENIPKSASGKILRRQLRDDMARMGPTPRL